MTIGPRVGTRDRQAYVRLQQPRTPPAPDGDGDVIEEPWTDLTPPRQFAEIVPATAQTLERLTVGATVIAQATHVITMPYHPQLTTRCRILDDRGRTFHITGLSDPNSRQVESVAICQEITT